MNFTETLLIRDCINNSIENPPYKYADYEMEDLLFYLNKYEKLLDEHMAMAGAMDILLKSANLIRSIK